MSIIKLCLRLAVFLCMLTIALFVTRLFLIPPRVAMRVAAPEPARVSFKVQQVVLDRAHAKLYTQLTVKHDLSTTVPARLWISTYLLSSLPEQGIGMLERCQLSEFATVEVQQPFAHGFDYATLNVAATYTGCGTSQNYYALVNISTKPPADTQLSINPVRIGSLTPVVVEHEQKR